MAVSSRHAVNDRWRRMHDGGDRLAGSLLSKTLEFAPGALAVERDRAAYIDVDDIRQLIVAELGRNR